MNYAKKFCDQLYNLAQTMSRRFPQDKDLLLAVKGLDILKNHNCRKVVNIFITHVYLKQSDLGKSYPQLIRARHEEFFFSSGNLITTSQINHKENEITAINMIDSIRVHWTDLNDDEKKNIWIYLDILCNLTEKYISTHVNEAVASG